MKLSLKISERTADKAFNRKVSKRLTHLKGQLNAVTLADLLNLRRQEKLIFLFLLKREAR